MTQSDRSDDLGRAVLSRRRRKKRRKKADAGTRYQHCYHVSFLTQSAQYEPSAQEREARERFWDERDERVISGAVGPHAGKDPYQEEYRGQLVSGRRYALSQS